MPVNFDIRPMVQQHSKLPVDRLRVANRFEDVRLSTIHRGIIFVVAAWSGPAILALKRFTQVLADLPTDTLDVVILDTDCLTADATTRLFGTSGFRAGGYGETIWVKDGAVLARELASSAMEQSLHDHTRKLLDDHAT